MNTRLDSLMNQLHTRLVELGVSDFSIHPSMVPNVCQITSGHSNYRVFPDEVLDALEGLDAIDPEVPDDVDSVWATIRSMDIDH